MKILSRRRHPYLLLWSYSDRTTNSYIYYVKNLIVELMTLNKRCVGGNPQPFLFFVIHASVFINVEKVNYLLFIMCLTGQTYVLFTFQVSDSIALDSILH